MPTRVVAQSGATAVVANMDDVDGEAYTLPAATTSALGGVKKMAAQADSTATDVAGLVTDFNALLAKARTAGLM
ncbi:MAG: head fiber protein [Kluyvera cryocrescens]|nr:head fiber protein [Kluyvera cryocrescens]